VLGGLFGYLIGMYLYNEIGEQVITFYRAEETFFEVRRWFDTYGVWVIVLAGFTPIPYKLFTITAGILSMALVPFLLFSLVGRGARFFLVSGLIFWGGVSFERMLRKYIDAIGWSVLIGLVLLYLLL
jgi:membrane protein YqaA with SNARE-associated domain